MSENEEEPDSDPSESVVIPSKLSPVDAEATRDAVLAAFNSADSGLSLDVDGEDLSVCALQILIATKRSADAKGLSIVLSDNAQSALNAIELH